MHHRLVAMEATSLAHGTNRIWKCMVHVVEKHLIPAVLASEEKGHDLVQKFQIAVMILMGKEMVPFDGMCEVGHEEPS